MRGGGGGHHWSGTPGSVLFLFLFLLFRSALCDVTEGGDADPGGCSQPGAGFHPLAELIRNMWKVQQTQIQAWLAWERRGAENAVPCFLINVVVV